MFIWLCCFNILQISIACAVAASKQFWRVFLERTFSAFQAITTSRENVKQVRGKQETRTCKLGCHLGSEGRGAGGAVRESGGGASKQIGRRG